MEANRLPDFDLPRHAARDEAREESTNEDTKEITPIRVALETLAVRMYTQRFDESDIATLEKLADEMEQAWREMDLARVRRANFQFHSAIYSGAGSDILRGLIERLWPRFATDLLWMIPGRGEESVAQPRAILCALKARDADLAAKAMATHINTAGAQIAGFIERQSGETGPRASGAAGESLANHRPAAPALTTCVEGKKAVMLLLPCTKTKPYSLSDEHQAINRFLLSQGFEPSEPAAPHHPPELLAALPKGADPRLLNNRIWRRGDLLLHRFVISEPMALVPYELVYYLKDKPSPAARYDDPGLFEHRGTAVCPWRADFTGKADFQAAHGYRWGDSEKAAFVETHNRLVALIVSMLERFGDAHVARLAYVSPKLTHRSFLTSVEEKRRAGLALGRRTGQGFLRFEGVNDSRPGWVRCLPNETEIEMILERLAQRLSGYTPRHRLSWHRSGQADAVRDRAISPAWTVRSAAQQRDQHLPYRRYGGRGGGHRRAGDERRHHAPRTDHADAQGGTDSQLHHAHQLHVTGLEASTTRMHSGSTCIWSSRSVPGSWRKRR